MPFAITGDAAGSESIKQVGGKAAHLGDLIRAGFPVPEAFFVTVEAWNKFMSDNELHEKIKSALTRTTFDDVSSLESTSEEIRRMILGAKMPPVVREAVIRAYRTLSHSKSNVISVLMGSAKGATADFVALRSSAIAEDIAAASSAGQYESFLNVRGDENVVLNLQKCWASFFLPRAIYYRNRNGQDQTAGMGVIVQRMINSEKSGVTFTVDPTDPKAGAGKIITEAVWGLGETIVQGLVEPDNYTVDKRNGDILEKKIGKKVTMRIRNIRTGLNEELNVKPEDVERQVLTDTETVTISAYGKKIEEYYKGLPQDIEWAVEKGKIYILQTRAVTVLERKESREITGGEILIKGSGVSPGVGSGPVKIIRGMGELDKVVKGDVLVTEMTSPDYVPAMEKSAAIVTDKGGSTCFSGGTKILTDKGFMTMAEVYRHVTGGETLLTLSVNRSTLKSEWKKINGAMKRSAPVWKVSVSQKGQSDENIIEVTPDHKMLTFENRELTEKKLEVMTEENKYACVVDRIPQLGAPAEITNDLAYVSGAMFSDGYFRADNRHGSVIFRQKATAEKMPFIAHVKNTFQNAFGFELRDCGSETVTNTIRGQKFTGTANRYVCSRKEPAMMLLNMWESAPVTAMSAKAETLAHYVAGLIDGDGSVSLSHHSGRVHIYTGDTHITESIIIACLRMGIFPYVYRNREDCLNIQLVEDVEALCKETKRVKISSKHKIQGTKLFAAQQVIGDIIDNVNYKGRIRPYVTGNLLIDAKKIKNNILPMVKDKHKKELEKIVSSDVRMQRLGVVGKLDVTDVYNIEVDGNHNYVVFTKFYTPVLVNNCHAAIVSRELGIPCIVGTERATQVLKEGTAVTVDATKGIVYAGMVDGTAAAAEAKPVEYAKTAVQVKCNIAFPQTAPRASHSDGVGLLRLEHMLTKAGMHPIEYVRQNRANELTAMIVEGVGQVAEAFKGKPVWVRTLDARTDEFRNMKGGENEPKEDNPMLGWHGVRRDLDEPELFRAQIGAFKQLHANGHTNVAIMLPFIINVEELRKARELAREFGLPETCKFGIMVETPAAALNIEEFCKEGIDFISFGSNDLTQLTLGLDRNNERLIKLFDEMHPAMQFLFKHAISSCKRYGVTTSICGELPSNREDAVRFLKEAGIDSVSVNIDAIDKVRGWLARM